MRVLVTGGSGFIGLPTVKKLLKQNHEVTVISRNPKVNDPEISGRVTASSCDMRVFSDVMKVINTAAPDIIIHSAYALTAAGEADPYWAIQVNVLGSNNIFEAARLAGIKRVVFGSSIAVYAPQEVYGERYVDEQEPLLKSGSIYGQTKALNEFMASKFEAKYGMELPCLRISPVYGTGRADRGGVTAWTSEMIASVVAGKPAKIPLRSDQQADFIYVEDVAEQFVRLAEAETLGHSVYNTGGILSAPADFARVVKKYYPDAEISFNENAPKWPYPHLLDGRRLAGEINFQPIGIEECLLDQINIERRKQGMDPLAPK